MTTSQRQIVRRAVYLARTGGRSRGFATRNGATALASTGGAALTLIDTAALPPTGAASTTAKNDWLFLPAMAAAHQKRLVSSYSGAAQQLTHQGPNYDATTIAALVAAGGTPYMVLKDDPDAWYGACLEALQQMVSEVKYDEFTPTGVTRYIVSAAPITLTGILHASQIVEVETHDSGDEVGYEQWQPWDDGYRSWRAYNDEQTVVLDFIEPLRTPQTTDIMRIKWTTQYTAPAADTTALDVDELLAAYGTLVTMADWLADVNNPDDDWNVIGKRARVQYEARRRLVLGNDAFRQVRRPMQQTGVLRMRGRGGRS